MAEGRKRIVVLDDDRDVADIIETVLLDEGFAVSCLYGPDDETVERAIIDLSPDVVIVDGSGPPRAPDPWTVAISLARHTPPIPTVLLTGSTKNRDEAMLGESDRAKAAGVAAVVPKPFDVDQLVLAVRNALSATRSSEGPRDAGNETTALMERLRAAGAHDLRTSNAGREWITFRAKPDGNLLKLYRWQTAGVYFIARYGANGARLEPLTNFSDAEGAAMYSEQLIEQERPDR